jgi:hypothetical protein
VLTLPADSSATTELSPPVKEYRRVLRYDVRPPETLTIQRTSDVYVAVTGNASIAPIFKITRRLGGGGMGIPPESASGMLLDPTMENILGRLSLGLAPMDDIELLSLAESAVEFLAQNPIEDRRAWADALAKRSDEFDD